MKVLLIGMDGGHIEMFNRGLTPFITSMIEKGEVVSIENDLMSRGWLEIATGLHASETGALYDKPKGNGTTDWNLKFAFKDIKDNVVRAEGIWDKINRLGYSVGVMNLPTVFPAPKVNGFFVSGGGGGAPVTTKIKQDLCYPPDIYNDLVKDDYIVDMRIPQLVMDEGLTEERQIFRQLDEMNRRRTEAFKSLAKRFKIDFGFLIYKTSSVTVETIVNGSKDYSSKDLYPGLKDYYNNFDNYIKSLKETFPEAKIILTSDHGTVPVSHLVNPNIILKDLGFQKMRPKSVKVYLFESLKRFIPFSLKQKIKGATSLASDINNAVKFNSNKTLAFCKTKNDWNHGVYINDKRFGGPVLESDKELLIEKIIGEINNHDSITDSGILAYRRAQGANPLFPDIAFRLPNGYLTNDSCKHFIQELKKSHSISGLEAILKGEVYSMKSHSPLFVVFDDNSDFSKYKSLMDLHNYIVNEYQNK